MKKKTKAKKRKKKLAFPLGVPFNGERDNREAFRIINQRLSEQPNTY